MALALMPYLVTAKDEETAAREQVTYSIASV